MKSKKTFIQLPALILEHTCFSQNTGCIQFLNAFSIVPKPVMVNCTIQFDYTQMNDIMKIMKQFECVVIKLDTQLFCSLEAGVPKNRQEDVFYKLRELRNVEVDAVAS